jgi:hypothetical protein
VHIWEFSDHKEKVPGELEEFEERVSGDWVRSGGKQ